MQQLRTPKEKILSIAQYNMERAAYSCRRISDLMKEMMINGGVDMTEIPEEIMKGMFPREHPVYVMTIPEGIGMSER